MENDLYVIVP